MPDPGFTQPDLCSICAADSHANHANAARGVFSAGGWPLAEDDRLEPLASVFARVLVNGGAWLVTGHRSQWTEAWR